MPKDKAFIGCSAILSGSEAVHGRAIVNAVKLALDHANQTGHLAVHLNLMAADDRDESEPARQAATQFVAEPRLLGVVGPMNSHAALAAAPIYERSGLAYLSPAASNPELTRRQYRGVFRMIAHDELQGRRAADFVVTHLKFERVSVVHDGSTFGQPLAEIFAQRATALGAEIISRHEIQRGQTDFQALASLLAADQPELIFFGVIEAEGLHLAPQLRLAGVTAVFFGTDGLKASRYLATPQYPPKGPYHSNACADINVEKNALAFKTAFERCYGRTHSVYAAEAYDAAGLLINAIDAAKPLSRKTVLAGITATKDYRGATGIITFDRNGDRRDPIIGFYDLSRGETVFLGSDRELLSPPPEYVT